MIQYEQNIAAVTAAQESDASAKDKALADAIAKSVKDALSGKDGPLAGVASVAALIDKLRRGALSDKEIEELAKVFSRGSITVHTINEDGTKSRTTIGPPQRGPRQQGDSRGFAGGSRPPRTTG